MGEPFSCDTSLLRKCVTRNLGYEVLGTVHRRLLEDDLEGLEADLSNGECAKGGAMLVFACLHGARRCAQYLVKQGALEGLEIMKICGGPLGFFIPITMAAALCHWEVVESLMEGGAEAHAFDSGERSALLIAVDNYPNANLEFLLRHEATRQHINTANGYGMTPLMAASASAVPLLVEAGGDVNLDTPEGGTALGHACQFGQLDKIKALGKYGADVQHADCHGITPLMQATQRGQADIVEYLLGRPGINIDAKAADGNTALYLACDNANFEVLQLLVAAGARVEPKASDEWGPLALAAFRGKIEVVKYLAEECGADEQRAGPDGRTPLILAAEENRADIVEYLLGRPGMDIQAKTAVGVTALDIACQNGHLETVKLLVGAGANLKPQANEVVGPVQIAIARGHLEVVKYLVECGADDRRVYPGRCTGLERAAREGHADVVEYLLGRPGVDIDAKTPAGATMLSTACRKGHVEVVKLLMAAGARVDAHSDTELPATTSAVVGGHLGLLKYLVEDAGVDVLRVDRPVNQPLIWAINLGHTDIVQYLLGLPGMDINAKIALGERVLDFACGSASGSSHLEVVKLLVAAGARVNPQASDEFGPLALAASRGRTEVVKYLMEECGADERRAGPYGYTPLMLAAQGGHADIEEYLRRTISCREQEALQAAEERAAVAAAALLEEEERAAPKASTTKKRKKSKKRAGGALPSQEQGSTSTLETSENTTDTQAVTAGLSSLGLGQEATVTGGEGLGQVGESSIGSRAAAVSGITTAEDAGDEPQGLAVASDEAAATMVEHGKPASTEDQVKEARPLLVMPEELSCPISLELMTDPVVADDGNTYQRAAIEAWVHKCTAAGRPLTSPLTGADMGPNLKPNLLVRSLVRGYDGR